MAQYEYMDNEKIQNDYENWKRYLPKDKRKELETRYRSINLFGAYINELGKLGWEISIAGGASVVYLAKREIDDRSKTHLRQQSPSAEQEKESFYR